MSKMTLVLAPVLLLGLLAAAPLAAASHPPSSCNDSGGIVIAGQKIVSFLPAGALACSLSLDCTSQTVGACVWSVTVTTSVTGLAAAHFTNDIGQSQSCTSVGSCTTAALTYFVDAQNVDHPVCDGSITTGVGATLTCAAVPV